MITFADDVPSVVRDACHYWERVYRLEAWSVYVEMADNFPGDDPEGDTGCGAETTTDEPVRLATVTFRRGSMGEDFALYAAHEFMHIAHSGIDHAFARVVDLAPERLKPLAIALYRDALERYVVDMTHLVMTGQIGTLNA